MRQRQIDLPFSERTGVGRLFFTKELDDTLRFTIDKHLRGNMHTAGSMFVLMDDELVEKVRDVLDLWLSRHRIDPPEFEEPERR